MRLFKMLGLAAVAAVAAMAFLGAGSASASAICATANASVDGSGNLVCSSPISLLLVEGVANDPTLDVGSGETILCSALDLHEHLKVAAGVITGAPTLTWLGPCVSTVSGCEGSATVTSEGKPTTDIEYIKKTYKTVAEGNALVTLLSSKTKVVLKCFGFPVTCTYAPASVDGTSNNGTGTLTVSAAIASPGFPCPAGTELASIPLKMAEPVNAGETGKLGDSFVITEK